MRRLAKRKMYKLISDTGFSFLSVTTLSMISSMLTNQDYNMTLLSTGLLSGSLVCKLGTSYLKMQMEDSNNNVKTKVYSFSKNNDK